MSIIRNLALRMCICTVSNANVRPPKCALGIDHQQCRTISRTNSMTKSARNYYDDLDLLSTATQDEIKTAYYELSKKHHPDTNTEPDGGTNKFLQITEAFKVLGNVKSRETYDKENERHSKLGYSAGLEEEFCEGTFNEEKEDCEQARFYRQHMRRSEIPYMNGRPDARKYDAWLNRLTKT